MDMMVKKESALTVKGTEHLDAEQKESFSGMEKESGTLYSRWVLLGLR